MQRDAFAFCCRRKDRRCSPSCPRIRSPSRHEIARITRYRAALPAGARDGGVRADASCARGRAQSSRAPTQMYFTAAGLEQASSERMARHHARATRSFEQHRRSVHRHRRRPDRARRAQRARIAVDIDPRASRAGRAQRAAHTASAQHVTVGDADVRERSRASESARRSSIRRADRRTVACRPARASRRSRGVSSSATRMPVGIKAAPGLPTSSSRRTGSSSSSRRVGSSRNRCSGRRDWRRRARRATMLPRR